MKETDRCGTWNTIQKVRPDLRKVSEKRKECSWSHLVPNLQLLSPTLPPVITAATSFPQLSSCCTMQTPQDTRQHSHMGSLGMQGSQDPERKTFTSGGQDPMDLTLLLLSLK